MNIFHNGLQAIQAKLELAPFQGEITITTELTDTSVLLLIGDNGIGIPESIVDQIFQDFFTTREVGQGMGQSVGGRIEVLFNSPLGSCL
nr:ATP-binding protein [uncultured Desulfobulbus sp.]